MAGTTLILLLVLTAMVSGNSTTPFGDGSDEASDSTTIWIVVLVIALLLVLLFICVYCSCARKSDKRKKHMEIVQMPSQVVVQPQGSIIQSTIPVTETIAVNSATPITSVQTAPGLSTPFMQPIDFSSQPVVSSLHTVSTPVGTYVPPVFKEQSTILFRNEPVVVPQPKPKIAVTKSRETFTKGQGRNGQKVTVTTTSKEIQTKPKSKIVSAVQYLPSPVVTSVVQQPVATVVQPAAKSVVLVEKKHSHTHSPGGHVHGPFHREKHPVKTVMTTTTVQRPVIVSQAPPQPVITVSPTQRIHLKK